MRNILIVKWCDVMSDDELVLHLSGMFEHDDIVKILRHTETEVRQKDVSEVYLLRHGIMTCIIVPVRQLKMHLENL